MKITANKGLLWEGDRLIGLPEADEVARPRGFQYAEQLVRVLAWLDGAPLLERSTAALRGEDPGVLDVLSEDPDIFVRWLVARSKFALPTTLSRLARDRDWLVRVAVAKNPRTPEEAVRALRNDPDSDVRAIAQAK